MRLFLCFMTMHSSIEQIAKVHDPPSTSCMLVPGQNRQLRQRASPQKAVNIVPPPKLGLLSDVPRDTVKMLQSPTPGWGDAAPGHGHVDPHVEKALPNSVTGTGAVDHCSIFGNAGCISIFDTCSTRSALARCSDLARSLNLSLRDGGHLDCSQPFRRLRRAFPLPT